MIGKQKFYIIGLMLLLMTQCVVTKASVKLFDFEVENDLSIWSLRSQKQDNLNISSEFATSGSHSLEFYTPIWKTGMETCPAFQGIPSEKDWTGYDRLVIDIANPNTRTFRYWVIISDSKPDFRKGFQHEYTLPAISIKRYVVDISKMPAIVDRSDISLVHFYTYCPEKDTHMYFDNITLLKPGENIPPIPNAMIRQENELLSSGINDAMNSIDKCKALLGGDSDLRLSVLARELASIQHSDTMDIDKLYAAAGRVENIIQRIERLASLESLRNSMKSLSIPTDTMLVGIASSAKKVLPQDVPTPVTAAKLINISAARNEKESFQIAVTPAGVNTLKGVTVGVSDLHSKNGNVLAKSNIDCDVVGYVKTKAPDYHISYVGWWPDPILDFLGPVDVDYNTLQTFWIRVKVPKSQAPGLYKGKLTVSAQDSKPIVLDVSLRVRSFTMPDCSPIPTAITAYIDGKSLVINTCGEDNWQKKVKYDYADFLADYYINYDHLYEAGPPDYDILKHLRDEGRLVAFNMGNFDNAGEKADFYKPIYEKCKELDIINHAYVYGFDEVGAARFAEIANSTKKLKETFPDVFLLTTAIDPSYGMNSTMKSIDGWCPLTPSFNSERAAVARAAGKKVWWYICCQPLNPYANWFVDYDAVEIRLLMGAMTTKYKPDGFLYYSLAIWNGNKPITSGPYTKWNPRSWGTTNGDGSIYCYGPGGKPVPTIRLENYRDGLEDFAYAKILESIIDKYNAKGTSLTPNERNWLVDARQALVIPENLVKDMSAYSHDPETLKIWRDKIADMIDSSGMSDIDPWGKDFGVRGFDNTSK